MKKFLVIFLSFSLVFSSFFSINIFAEGRSVIDNLPIYRCEEHQNFEGLREVVSKHESFVFVLSNDRFMTFEYEDNQWSYFDDNDQVLDYFYFDDSELYAFAVKCNLTSGGGSSRQQLSSLMSMLSGIITLDFNGVYNSTSDFLNGLDNTDYLTYDKSSDSFVLSPAVAEEFRKIIIKSNYESYGASVFFPTYVDNLAGATMGSGGYSDINKFNNDVNKYNTFDFGAKWRWYSDGVDGFFAFKQPSNHLYIATAPNSYGNTLSLYAYDPEGSSYFNDVFLVLSKNYGDVTSVDRIRFGKQFIGESNGNVYPYNLVFDFQCSAKSGNQELGWSYSKFPDCQLCTQKKGAYLVIWPDLDSLLNYLHSNSNTFISSSYDDSDLTFKLDNLQHNMDDSINAIINELNHNKSNLSAEELQKLIDAQSKTLKDQLNKIEGDIEDIDEDLSQVKLMLKAIAGGIDGLSEDQKKANLILDLMANSISSVNEESKKTNISLGLMSNAIESANEESKKTNQSISGLSDLFAEGNNSIAELVDINSDIFSVIDTGFDSLDFTLNSLFDVVNDLVGFVDDIEDYLAKILSAVTSDTGDDFLYINSDELQTTLESINNSISDQNDSLTEMLGLVKNIDKNVAYLTELEEEQLQNDVKNNGQKLADKAKDKFPSSVPWDLYAIYGILAAEPKAPAYTLDYSSWVNAAAGTYVITIDCSSYEPVSAVCRGFLSITFILGLIHLTRKMFFD